ncbi:MAG: sulfatase [Acidobacteria bacterium]|nr:sulfatase [Acidobacteriota bacterium]MCW5968351.1 sulfatase [Blastocatellales bacterium]
MRRILCPFVVVLLIVFIAAVPQAEVLAQRSGSATRLAKIPARKPRNIVFILADDHRYDALGFLGHPFLETPHLDAMARRGVHFPNAFVTTSLCSPSRASILTGLYAHRHRVVDNNNPVPPGTVYFSQYLKRAGYDTAFIGKWHMGGEGDDPQPGFDYWVSFRGQGTYLPGKDGLNVNGRRVPQRGYITDELTDYAIDWLKNRRSDRPFMLYLSHKAVHAEFIPADRHKGRYADKVFTPPASIDADPQGGDLRPRWVRDQRNSWHGVEFPYHSDLDIAEYYKRYTETLLAVDDSVGRVMDELRRRGVLDSTLIVYMGDNGFAFGEHGLIDKRTAYEESMRVPMIAHCPEMFGTNERKVSQVVANIDIAPTLLETAGMRAPNTMDGRSFLSIAEGKQTQWRSALLYEYYWERNFPQTPTIHALRSDRFKYIHYHGIWDTDELYDLENDPFERRNLINDPAHAGTVKKMNRELFDMLGRSRGMYIPLYPDRGAQQNKRRKGGSRSAEFPPVIYQ